MKRSVLRGRHKDARTQEPGSGADERFEILIGLADTVSAEGEACAVATEATVMLDDNTGAVTHRVTNLAVPVVPVDPHAQCIAGCDVSSRRSPYLITGDDHVDWRALHASDKFAYLKSELGIQGQRPVVIGGLDETDARQALLGGPSQDIFHRSRPIPWFWTLGATVTGPIPAMDDRSSMKALPTTLPPASATTE